MKKITCLLALFLCVIGTAMAQITDISELSNDKKYTVWTARGGWAVNAEGTEFKSSNDVGLGTTLTADNMKNAQCQFQFLSNDGGTTIYLFSVYANKYVNNDCSLSTTATHALTFNKQDDGTFVVKFDTDHCINLGGGNQMVVNGWNYADAGNKVTITEVPDALVEVTWNYQIGDQTYKTVTQNLAANTACTAPAVDFFVADSQSAVNTGSGETLTITVSGHENLPFQKTTDLNDPKWYAVSIHTNQAFYLWHYAANDALVDATIPTLGASDYTVPSDDAYFWCFTGSLIDGFKIYNKKAGTSYTLNSTSDEAHVGTADNNDLWDLVKSTSSIANSVCFAAHGTTNYINRQGGLKYWTSTDEGSSVLFYTPASFPVNYLESYINIPANAVGSSTYFNEETKADALTKIAAAQADEFDFTAAQTLAGVATNVANGSFVEMAPGYYRIYSAQPGLYANNRGLIYDSNSGNMCWNEVTKQNVNNIVKMEAADEGKYYLYACNAQKYMQGVAGALDNAAGENSGITVTALGNAQYNLVFGNGTMHANNHGGGSGTGSNLVNWGGSTNSASAWYIIPATELEVALNTVDGASYASAYLPFPVQGEGIYTGTINGNGSSLDMTAQTGVVPAETGIVIKSANTTATLTIGGTADADVTDNSLKGSLTALTGDLTSYLVLGMGNTTRSLGFFTPSESLTTIDANKAYLLVSEVPSSSRAIAMNFGGEATGVGTVITENGIQSNAPVFDLSGRRVMQTVKGGLYIQNGKKFIVK